MAAFFFFWPGRELAGFEFRGRLLGKRECHDGLGPGAIGQQARHSLAHHLSFARTRSRDDLDVAAPVFYRR